MHSIALYALLLMLYLRVLFFRPHSVRSLRHCFVQWLLFMQPLIYVIGEAAAAADLSVGAVGRPNAGRGIGQGGIGRVLIGFNV